MIRSKKMFKVIKFTFLLVFLFIMTLNSYADIPRQINYQGYLTDPFGKSIESELMAVDITFKFFSTETGQQNLITPVVYSNVAVYKGFYNVDITIPDNIFSTENIYMEVVVNGETLTPRISLTSVPYAFDVLHSDYAYWARTVTGSFTVEKITAYTVNSAGELIFPGDISPDVFTNCNSTASNDKWKIAASLFCDVYDGVSGTQIESNATPLDN
jgi:hypothetical protein